VRELHRSPPLPRTVPRDLERRRLERRLRPRSARRHVDDRAYRGAVEIEPRLALGEPSVDVGEAAEADIDGTGTPPPRARRREARIVPISEVRKASEQCA